jgi:integrase
MAAASQPLQDIARIILETGMRPEEVFRIETANLDFAQRTIFNPFGKTRAARRKLTMTEDVLSILKARAVAARTQYVFPSPDNLERPIGSVRKAHDAAVRRAKVRPAFRLYDLRHTYATRVVMAGVDLPTLAALLGHTNIQMTMRYVHPAEEHKREATPKLENFKIAEAIKLTQKSQGVATNSATIGRFN